MQDIQNLDFLKLRLGWGRIGNDKVINNLFTTNMSTTNPTFISYVLGTTQALANGATVLTYANKGGKWETTEQWNIGLDFGSFRGLLSGNVDLFLKDTKDALLTVKGPAYIGNRWDAMANVGTVRNKGIEISLDHKNTVGKMNYSLNGNVSFIKNELTALNGGEKVWGKDVHGDNTLLCDIGLPVYTIWGYVYEGIFASTEEAQNYKNSEGIVIQPGAAGGDAKFRDRNDDGIINDNDKTDIGNPFPWLTYGFSASMQYQGFDLQLFLQGIYGNKIFNEVLYRTQGKGEEATLSTKMRDVWTTENKSGTIPNPFGSPNNTFASSRFVENGSYLRLKNVQLGYTIPKKATQKFLVDKLRIYVSANNLLTFTNYTGYDPEVGGGVDFGNYPQARTFMVGANISF